MPNLDWVQPGARGLARFPEDGDWDHERVFLWQVDAERWVILTAHGLLYFESLKDYSRLVPMPLGRGGLPADALHVVTFARALTARKLAEKIIEGRNEARSVRRAEGLPRIEAEDASADGVDWQGRPLAIPGSGMLATVGRRFRGKQAPKAVARPAGAATTAASAGAGAAAAKATAPTPAAAGAVDSRRLEPKAGYVWLYADVSASERRGGLAGHAYGSEAGLTPQALIFGEKAINILPSGDAVHCEQVRIEDATAFAGQHANMMRDKALGQEATPRPDEGGGGGGAADLDFGGGVPGPEMAGGVEDVRTCWIDYDEHGVRYKEWRKVMAEATVERFRDSPVGGAPGCVHALKAMSKRGGSPAQWFLVWCREMRCGKKDRVYHEMRCLVDCLEIGGTFDQLNMGSIVALEVVMRRLLAIVEAHQKGIENPNWELAQYLTTEDDIADLLSPELRSDVTRKAKDKMEVDNFRARARTALDKSEGAGGAAAATETGGLPSTGDGAPPGGKARGGRGRGGRTSGGRG